MMSKGEKESVFHGFHLQDNVAFKNVGLCARLYIIRIDFFLKTFSPLIFKPRSVHKIHKIDLIQDRLFCNAE